MNSIAVNNLQMPVKEFGGQRVVTFTDIDRVHERPEGTASRNFRSNRKHFIKNEDYFEISKNDVPTNFVGTYGFNKKAPSGMLFTETGYLMLVKSFKDDLAWDVQRQLVSTYFKIKEMAASQNTQSILSTDLQDQISTMAEIVARKTVERILSEKENTPTGTSTTKYIISNQVIVDPIRDTIKPLAELYGDITVGYNGTFRKVYEAMNCNWKYRQSRYKNSKGNKNDTSKIKLIERDKKLLKMFMDTVNMLINNHQIAI